MATQRPWAYLDTGTRVPHTRTVMHGFARCAVHYPELGRAVEFHVNQHGAWSVMEGPDAVHGGEFTEVAKGDLRPTPTKQEV